MGEEHKRITYPFSAIVGQENMKIALILNAINPSIGGVLIRGERGTAKSTAVRSLAAVLPEQNVAIGCPYNCDPGDYGSMCEFCRSKGGDLQSIKRKMRVVELPVSATEDKVVGTLDISAAIKNGDKKFEPGILAEANRNILYVDEVNLLNDHIVDVLLDSAAMGVNTVEREGISFSHPAKFILVGTMNPEEGDLRPQLLDRFGLCVTVEGLNDPENRIKVIERLMEFSKDRKEFTKKWYKKNEVYSNRVKNACNLLKYTHMSEELMKCAINMCLEARTEGHRADIVMVKTSKALAAYDGRTEVEEKDVKLAAVLVLSHRSRNPPDNSPPPDNDDDEDDPDDNSNDKYDNKRDDDSKDDLEPPPDNKEKPDDDSDGSGTPDSSSTTEFKTGAEFVVKHNTLNDGLRLDNIVRDSGGKRSNTESTNGRYVGYRIPHGIPTSVALDATLRAAALHSSKNGNNPFHIELQDVREKVRERKIGNLVVFVVDASGSMGAQQRMIAVKGAISSLLTDAYQKRDRVALVVFRGLSAELIVPPTNSVELAKKNIDKVPTGGKTPLGDGLKIANELILKEKTRDQKIRPLMVVVSDGRGNVSNGASKPMDEIRTMSAIIREAEYPTLVIDSESGGLILGFAKKMAEDMGAKYIRLDEIRADNMSMAIKKFSD